MFPISSILLVLVCGESTSIIKEINKIKRCQNNRCKIGEFPAEQNDINSIVNILEVMEHDVSQLSVVGQTFWDLMSTNPKSEIGKRKLKKAYIRSFNHAEVLPFDDQITRASFQKFEKAKWTMAYRFGLDSVKHNQQPQKYSQSSYDKTVDNFRHKFSKLIWDEITFSK